MRDVQTVLQALADVDGIDVILACALLVAALFFLGAFL
jgi:lipopolysaccharide export LptBFGC system permease protein LptF